MSDLRAFAWPLVAASIALLVVAGCGGDDDDNGAQRQQRTPEEQAEGRGAEGSIEATNAEERVIRNWIVALNEEKFDLAARYFANGAVVEQVDEMTLRGRADAVRFNRSLPCRAEVTDFDREGSATLAAFRLKQGRGGGCSHGGRARVRFVIRGGLIEEWRQLPERAPEPGDSA